ncbi:pathogenesis-related protein 1A-like [Spinacia oleracea]|uniref:Pathogenesis-related protein 1A-like n=1 Tax=Spinacia oleracea TaxID=3562 RepID=A0A9R0JZZ8_SPIOL|nr:pathogenesis-related protein 1A-like [Spinacia oleracea]
MKLLLFLHLFCAILATTLVTLSHAQIKNTLQQFLDVHNKARAQVGVPPLKWNQTLAEYAQIVANRVGKTCDFTAKSPSGGPYGENTASGYWAFTTYDAVNQWVGEKPNYDNKMNVCRNGKECKHYKQVVWKDSLHLGCAGIFCGTGQKRLPFVVCEYYPPGNVPGKFAY